MEEPTPYPNLAGENAETGKEIQQDIAGGGEKFGSCTLKAQKVQFNKARKGEGRMGKEERRALPHCLGQPGNEVSSLNKCGTPGPYVI